MAQVTKQIISPVFVTESGDSYIALDGKAFLVGENTITEAEITTAPGEFRSLVLALNNFTLTNEGLTWFNGINRIRFVKESNNFFVNNSEVLAESLTNHLLASGIVNYTNKAKIQLFEYAAQNINNFVSLDFAQKIEEGNVKCYVMKLNEDFFVYRINEANKIYKFGKLDANAAFDYVKEQTGYEITDMTQELLEGARKEAAEKLEKINLLEQMIAFLKDQRGVIAEADKSIQEIKEADTLINSEIKRLEEEVEAIKNGTEKVDEGCGKCGTDGCICATESEETETDATTEETTNEEATEETVKEGKDKWIVYDTESKEILEIYKDLKAAEAFAASAERDTAEWKKWRQGEQWQKWAQAMAPAVTARRRVLRLLGDKQATRILFSEVAPRFASRPGGYTRILKLAMPRLGDAGPRAILEFVGESVSAAPVAPELESANS